MSLDLLDKVPHLCASLRILEAERIVDAIGLRPHNQRFCSIEEPELSAQNRNNTRVSHAQGDRGRLGLADARPRDAEIGEVEREQRPDPEAEAGVRNQPARRGGGRAERRADADARIEIGGGDPDPLRGRGESRPDRTGCVNSETLACLHILKRTYPLGGKDRLAANQRDPSLVWRLQGWCGKIVRGVPGHRIIREPLCHIGSK